MTEQRTRSSPCCWERTICSLAFIRFLFVDVMVCRSLAVVACCFLVYLDCTTDQPSPDSTIRFSWAVVYVFAGTSDSYALVLGWWHDRAIDTCAAAQCTTLSENDEDTKDLINGHSTCTGMACYCWHGTEKTINRAPAATGTACIRTLRRWPSNVRSARSTGRVKSRSPWSQPTSHLDCGIP